MSITVVYKLTALFNDTDCDSIYEVLLLDETDLVFNYLDSEVVYSSDEFDDFDFDFTLEDIPIGILELRNNEVTYLTVLISYEKHYCHYTGATEYWDQIDYWNFSKTYKGV